VNHIRQLLGCRVKILVYIRIMKHTGSSPRKPTKSAIFIFSQKKGLYMWVDHFPKYYIASSTKNPIKSGLKRMLLYTIVLIPSMFFAPPGKFVSFSTSKRIEVCNRACWRENKDSFGILASFPTN